MNRINQVHARISATTSRVYAGISAANIYIYPLRHITFSSAISTQFVNLIHRSYIITNSRPRVCARSAERAILHEPFDCARAPNEKSRRPRLHKYNTPPPPSASVHAALARRRRKNNGSASRTVWISIHESENGKLDAAARARKATPVAAAAALCVSPTRATSCHPCERASVTSARSLSLPRCYSFSHVPYLSLSRRARVAEQCSQRSS